MVRHSLQANSLDYIKTIMNMYRFTYASAAALATVPVLALMALGSIASDTHEHVTPPMTTMHIDMSANAVLDDVFVSVPSKLASDTVLKTPTGTFEILATTVNPVYMASFKMATGAKVVTSVSHSNWVQLSKAKPGKAVAVQYKQHYTYYGAGVHLTSAQVTNVILR